MLPGSKRKQLEVLIVPGDFVIEVVRTTSAVFVRLWVIGGTSTLSLRVCRPRLFYFCLRKAHCNLGALVDGLISEVHQKREATL